MLFRSIAFVFVALVLGGCMQTAQEYPQLAKIDGRDKKLLDKAPYAKVELPEPYRPHIVAYHRKEAPGSVVVDSDSKFLYYVLPDRKAVRYGVAVGEEAMAFSGVATVGRKVEWPSWTPTESIKKRLDNIPDFVGGGPHNPLGARGIYLYVSGKDTLYRVHGTNQPEYIGQAISSGCIRMVNEDIIDLYDRVKMGAVVVVLAPGEGLPPPAEGLGAMMAEIRN
jgi:lipoprotein-anchoring transpeptidase ErfK/SrfK